MRNCAGCNQHINICELLECCKCKGPFHYMCVNISRSHFVSHKQDLERTWICPECGLITLRTPKNDHTPIRNHITQTIMNDTLALSNESLRLESANDAGSAPDAAPSKCSMVPSGVSIETILVELREFRSLVTAHFVKQDERLSMFTSDIKDLQACCKALSLCCSSLKSEFDELAATVQNLTDENDSFRTATEHYDKRIRELESAKSNLEQNLAATRIRVNTIESSIGSNTYAAIAKSHKQMTQVVHRNSHKPTPTTPPPIIEKSRYSPPEVYDKTIPALAGERRGRRSSRSRRSVIKATGEADSELKLIEPVKYIHIWNLHTDTTADNVLSYMRKKGKGSAFAVGAPPPSHKSHRCFIVSVPVEHFDYFMSPSNWPRNMSLQEWFMFRNRPNQTNTNPSGTFFRQ